MNAPALAPPPRTAGVRFFAWLYAPQALRDATAALLAIEQEITASTRAGLDHSVAHARLGWWQEEAGRLLAASPQHPLTLALRHSFYSASLPPPDLRPLPELATRRLAQLTLGRETDADGEAANATLWAEGLFRPLAALALPAEHDLAGVLRLGCALYAHESAPTSATHSALAAALSALPRAFLPPLRGSVVWAALALRPPRPEAAKREAFAENWTAWRVARHALQGRLRTP